MAYLQVFALLSVLVAGASSQSEIRMPPKFTTPTSTTNLYYNENQRVVVNCSADGNPQPTYRWLQNGTVVQPTSYITYDSTTGDLTIPTFSAREQATYICVASNVFNNGQGGQITAANWSPRVRLFQSRIDKFDEPLPIDKQATEYNYLVMQCTNKKTIVGATIIYNWYETDRTGIPLDAGRLFIDQEGSLHFTYVLAKDALKLSYYCGISVVNEPMIRLGTMNKLTVSTRSPVAVQPVSQYTNTGVKGYLSASVKLECVFSGYDPTSQTHIPDITWVDDANKPIVPSEKYIISGEGRVLTITKLTEDDEKQYMCRARNSIGDAQATVFLNVTSGPIFLPNGAPVDQTVPENTDAVFRCDTRSASRENPPGPPTWAINGVNMGPQNDPNKFQLSDDNKVLTIKNVKKATDILCVKCEVSNDIDTVMSSACLNVILPITIVTQPKLPQEVRHGGNVDLTVTAKTDASMTLNYRWEFNNKSYVGSNAPPHMFYNPLTMLAYINTSELSEDQYISIGGHYTRVIYNLYETKNVDIEVILADRTGAVLGGIGIDPWVIGLIIALILLLIIILIIIFIICRKKQEGDYNVDKKETGAGLDPEKELKDKEFNAFSPPAYDEYYNYPDSKPPGGDPEYEDTIIGDDESLGEYGKEDITHFNEDGSFIGIYQSKQPPPAHPAESTI